MKAHLPQKTADHPVIATPRIGVLIVNLGTPDAPTPAAVKRYLREFLSDRRVVELPPFLWQPILRGIILNTRPRKSARAYAEIWTDQGSPLAAHTRSTAEALAQRFAHDNVMVDWAMRYGNPAMAERISAMIKAGCDRILLAPLYPQYSGATTASAQDAMFAALGTLRWQPAVRTLPPYHDHPDYIAMLAGSAKAAFATMKRKPDALLLSFHGMPERTLRLGDPYHCHCIKTARLLAESLGDDFDGPVEVSFQSRFGRARWLQPSTEEKLRELLHRKIKNLAVMAPGFSADCLETLEELAIRGREDFLQRGGESFFYVACANENIMAINLYEKLIRTNIAGWI